MGHPWDDLRERLDSEAEAAWEVAYETCDCGSDEILILHHSETCPYRVAFTAPTGRDVQ